MIYKKVLKVSLVSENIPLGIFYVIMLLKQDKKSLRTLDNEKK